MRIKWGRWLDGLVHLLILNRNNFIWVVGPWSLMRSFEWLNWWTRIVWLAALWPAGKSTNGRIPSSVVRVSLQTFTGLCWSLKDEKILNMSVLTHWLKTSFVSCSDTHRESRTELWLWQMFLLFTGNGYIEGKELENFFKELETARRGPGMVSVMWPHFRGEIIYIPIYENSGLIDCWLCPFVTFMFSSFSKIYQILCTSCWVSDPIRNSCIHLCENQSPLLFVG